MDFSPVTSNVGLGVTRERCMARNDFYMGLGQIILIDGVQEAHTGIQLFHYNLPIEFTTTTLKAIVNMIMHEFRVDSCVPHYLFGYTSDIHSSAARLVALHHGDHGAQLSLLAHTGQPAQPAAEYQAVTGHSTSSRWWVL